MRYGTTVNSFVIIKKDKGKGIITISVIKAKNIRGVLGNKCAGQPNLKTVYFTETST
jgi:hypothetical protein